MQTTRQKLYLGKFLYSIRFYSTQFYLGEGEKEREGRKERWKE
jgi:hypothetical protein